MTFQYKLNKEESIKGLCKIFKELKTEWILPKILPINLTGNNTIYIVIRKYTH